MKIEKGKIFNAQEVQAIIAGNKTMFREVLKVQPTNENQVFSTVASSIRNKDIGTHNFINPKATWEQTKKFKCPYQVGQKIKPKPKSGSIDLQLRLFGIELLIKKIRVERLADISEEDARLEGFPVDHLGNYYEPSKLDPWQGYARASFSLSWNPTHKKPEEKFYANPFVWVVDFKINK